MRSLLLSLLGRGTGVSRSDLARGRPEAMRRRSLAANARTIVLISAVSAPAAIYLLTLGMLMPFVIAMVGLATGFLTLAMHSRGHYERAAFGQVYGTLLVGLVLTLVDPAVVDFGLAVSMLAPVQASLLARTSGKRPTWVFLLAVLLLGCLGAAGIVHWPEPPQPEYSWIAAVTFVVTSLMLAVTAARLNSALAVYEQGQFNAYRHLVENVRDAVMRFSGEGEVLFASKSAESLLGCYRYELSGSGLIDRIHVLDRPAYMKAFSEARHDGRSRTMEIRMRRDDRDEPSRVPQFIWVEIALSPVAGGRQGEAGSEIVALLRNVTDRHAQDAQMREARRLAEDASNAKSRFLATIGHELRTPLNAIVGFSEMMTSGVVGELSPAHREYADIIHRSGHHLLDVVKMLLDMSRLEAGKFELQAEPFEPERLIEPCFQMVEAMARERKIKLVADLPRMLPTIVADERACRQVLINLLSNAIKFSHEGGTVSVSMKRQGASLNLSVTDRGIGMDSDAVARIGEAFFQAQDGLARRYEGTGLGLSIVKGLVDLHGGALRAISSPGEGTTVTVLLPLNGPATKAGQTGEVAQLIREPDVQASAPWQDGKRRAQ